MRILIDGYRIGYLISAYDDGRRLDAEGSSERYNNFLYVAVAKGVS